MKIENRIVLSNVFHIALLLLIGVFAMQNLNAMLTKLRFVEIADDLNASFLEMRISEKNYFLYGDKSALQEIRDKIDNTLDTIESVEDDITRAIGHDNLLKLKSYLTSYSSAVEKTRKNAGPKTRMETALRAEGKQLREFSGTITKLERKRVNNIISSSKRILFYSFWAILATAVLVSHYISQKILRSLREIEKLASLGILTAGVAHELTNPVNNISMIAQNFIEYYDYMKKENKLDLMKKVEHETERIGEIVNNLLDFSKPKAAYLKESDINETVREALKLMQNTLDISNIETNISLAEGLPCVNIDDHQIEQVLVNLILNAVQATGPGGWIFLKTMSSENGEMVKVEISDTGKGISPEFLPHIFDPFFSTKGVGGTGLGLSVSYGIIKNHNGNIKVESTVGAGTTFTIELPVYEKEGVQ